MQPELSQTGSVQPLARILVVSFNSATYLHRCIDNLRKQTEPRFEVVIVDNASRDADAIRLPEDPRFSLIRLDRNLGFAAANNLAAAGAKAPWLVTLNPDAFPQPDWLETLLAAAAEHPDTAMFGSTQLFEHDPGMVDGEGDRYSIFGVAWRANYAKRHDPPYFSGEVFSPCAAAAMYRRDYFEAVGGFDESFFCYYEDVDLGFRIRLLGGVARQVGPAIVHHVSSGVTRDYGDFMRYYCYRNLVWTMAKNVPLPGLIMVASLCVLTMLYLFVFRWRAVRTRTALRALHDGVIGVGPALRQRREIQARRVASQADLFRAMTWSPISLKLRR
jgi:N-acetylglucosaminyl-diphospho-decaprenol L-rhamnosyltransferase